MCKKPPAAINSTVVGSRPPAAINSTVVGSRPPAAIDSTVVGSRPLAAIDSTVVGSRPLRLADSDSSWRTASRSAGAFGEQLRRQGREAPLSSWGYRRVARIHALPRLLNLSRKIGRRSVQLDEVWRQTERALQPSRQSVEWLWGTATRCDVDVRAGLVRPWAIDPNR
jgi:hypothetical protein